MIRDMEREENIGPMREGMVKVLTKRNKITIEWIPGYRETEGNKLADNKGKVIRNKSLKMEEKWSMID